jgi:hypothetical protein
MKLHSLKNEYKTVFGRKLNFKMQLDDFTQPKKYFSSQIENKKRI